MKYIATGVKTSTLRLIFPVVDFVMPFLSLETDWMTQVASMFKLFLSYYTLSKTIINLKHF